MNIRRGLIQLWILFSALWVLGVLGLTGADWYHAASYWYRTRRIEVTECAPKQTHEIEAIVIRAKRNAPLNPGESWLERFFNLEAFNCFSVNAPDGSKYIV